MENTLVSVIVPIYNVSNYIDSCVESIISQTYKNIEIILVDDGSTDDSGQKCESWREQDPRIKVLHKKNEGVSDARNYGLNQSNGEIICFVDGDDFIKEDLLEKTVPYMSDGTDMVVFGYIESYSDKREVNVAFKKNDITFENCTDNAVFLIHEFLKFNIGWSPWSRLYKREIIEKHKLQFVDTKRVFAEDQLFCMSYLCYTHRVECIDACLYYYRQRDNSITNSVRKNKVLRFAQKTEECKAFFEYVNGMTNKDEYLYYQPVFLYLLLESCIKEAIRDSKYCLSEVKEAIITEVSRKSDSDYLLCSLRKLITNRKGLLTSFDPINKLMIIECSKWLVGERNLYKLIWRGIRVLDTLRLVRNRAQPHDTRKKSIISSVEFDEDYNDKRKKK